jgi:glycosyltransferase involved in cell wall biosynthesis
VIRLTKILLFYPLLVAAIVIVAVVARVTRWPRRWARRRPRIVRSPRPMSGLSYIRDADRLRGYTSDLVVTELDRWNYPYVFKEEVDRVVDLSGPRPLLARVNFLLELMFQYDILVTYYNCSFFKTKLLRSVELPLLKLSGLKLIVVSYGSDVTLFDSPPTRFDWVGRCLLDYPPKGSEAEHDGRVLRGIRRLTRWADFRIAGDYSLTPFVGLYDLVFKYFPIDCQTWQPVERNSIGAPRIIHAPNHRHQKGTATLEQTCRELADEGVPLELRIVEGVPRNEVQDLYCEADLLVEELCSGASGLNGLEFLALGKPVLVYVNSQQLADPAFDLPLVNTNIDNVADVLRAVLGVTALRDRLGAAGRHAVEQFQSFSAISEVWQRIYEHLWQGSPLDLESTRHFGPNRQPRSRSENPRHAEFWPVPVDDLLSDIRLAIDGTHSEPHLNSAQPHSNGLENLMTESAVPPEQGS